MNNLFFENIMENVIKSKYIQLFKNIQKKRLFCIRKKLSLHKTFLLRMYWQ